MSIFGQTKGTELENQIAQLATGEAAVSTLADKLAELGIDKEAVEQVREFALQEKHHGEVTSAIIHKYAPEVYVEKNKDQNVYVCKVCGFEYVGDLNKEPADYKCPICAMPKTAFDLKC